MKATGEVMAIDRTFGSALNKALRGLEQAGAGRSPRTRAGRRRFDYLAAVYGGGADEDPDEDAADEPIRWIDEPARPASRPATPSGPPRRSSCAASSSRPTRGCGGSSACSAAASPRQTIQEATGIAPWFLAEMGRNVALEADVRAAGATLARAGDEPDGEAATLLATAKRAGFGDRELAALAGDRANRTSATPAWRSACGPATRWSTRARRSSPPRRRTSTRPTPRRARRRRRRRSPGPPPSSSARGRSGSGRGSSSTTARSRPPRRSASAAGRR